MLTAPAPKTCRTYFIFSRTEGFVKIGKARSIAKRIKELQIGSATLLELIGELPDNQEMALHRRFAADRQHGEWFRYTPEMAEFIAEHCK